MNELSINEICLIEGGVNWSKVSQGALGLVGSGLTAAGTGWTGAGIAVGVIGGVTSLGTIVRGFEED